MEINTLPAGAVRRPQTFGGFNHRRRKRFQPFHRILAHFIEVKPAYLDQPATTLTPGFPLSLEIIQTCTSVCN